MKYTVYENKIVVTKMFLAFDTVSDQDLREQVSLSAADKSSDYIRSLQ